MITILGMTACQKQEIKLLALDSMGKVIAVSREDGSGTRSEFETLIDISEAGAKNGIAIVVNKENPIDDLSVKQIKKLYEGDCKNWTDLK